MIVSERRKASESWGWKRRMKRRKIIKNVDEKERIVDSCLKLFSLFTFSYGRFPLTCAESSSNTAKSFREKLN
jgi:hypothetical protein